MTVTTDVQGRGAQNSAAIGASPAGLRLSSRRWKDPRLIVGILLVVCSAVGVVWVVNAADDRVAVWAVRGDIPAGSRVAPEKLVDVDVQCPSSGRPGAADDAVPEDLVAMRDFAAASLTRANVEMEDASDTRIVTLPVLRNQMPADLDVGRRVDVYAVGAGSR